MDDIVRAARLAPSVGPFTLKRLMFRAGIFGTDLLSAAELQRIIPSLAAELRETLSPGDHATAMRDLERLASAGPRPEGRP